MVMSRRRCCSTRRRSGRGFWPQSRRWAAARRRRAATSSWCIPPGTHRPGRRDLPHCHDAALDAAGLVPDQAIALPELRDRLQPPLVASTYVVLTIDACPGGPQSMIGGLAALGMTMAVGGGPGMACYDGPPGLRERRLHNGAAQGRVGGGGPRQGREDHGVGAPRLCRGGGSPRLTGGKQVPESVLGFDGPLLAVAPAAGGSGPPPTGEQGGLKLSPGLPAAEGDAGLERGGDHRLQR